MQHAHGGASLLSYEGVSWAEVPCVGDDLGVHFQTIGAA
jgi:hypothetical protein